VNRESRSGRVNRIPGPRGFGWPAGEEPATSEKAKGAVCQTLGMTTFSFVARRLVSSTAAKAASSAEEWAERIMREIDNVFPCK
jgi:hypothetical protein